LNKLNLACIFKENSKEIKQRFDNLNKWNLIFVISGRGPLAKDKISYLQGDIEDIITEIGNNLSSSYKNLSDKKILEVLNGFTKDPWRMRLSGAFQDIFFLTCFEKISEFVSLISSQFQDNLAIYIKTTNQGTSYHCEFDFYYDPANISLIKKFKEKIAKLIVELIEKGAFFSRPYGKWAKEIFAHQNPETVDVMKKVKKIFDPNNILNPGVLCFDD
jgi:FAD/FMN-containing dehydrogenase